MINTRKENFDLNVKSVESALERKIKYVVPYDYEILQESNLSDNGPSIEESGNNIKVFYNAYIVPRIKIMEILCKDYDILFEVAEETQPFGKQYEDVVNIGLFATRKQMK